MITGREAINKLYDMAARFDSEMRNKNYGGAKYIYDSAVAISVFLELPETETIILFGDRPYIDEDEEASEGLFREEAVLKAYSEYIHAQEVEIAETKKRYEAMLPEREALRKRRYKKPLKQ